MSVNRKVSVCVANSLGLPSAVDVHRVKRKVTDLLKRGGDSVLHALRHRRPPLSQGSEMHIRGRVRSHPEGSARGLLIAELPATLPPRLAVLQRDRTESMTDWTW